MNKIRESLLKRQVSTIVALLYLMASIFVSFLLANTVELPNGISLGALVFLTYPILIGILTIIFYLILSLIFKKWRLILLIIACITNLYCGISLHFDPPL
jgi:phosphatidylserine synthase